MDPLQIQIFHCIHRCVRRARLCGNDPVTEKCFEHRRKWIRQRSEFLSSVFAVDCLTYTVLSNHLHLVLRNRPDVVERWSDEQIARKWLQLYPKRKCDDGSAEEPNRVEIDSIMHDQERVKTLRGRLSDISWYMKSLAEKIARQSNGEDQVTGHFWESRFKAQALLDEASVLACAAYVDLNPIRAALAETLEESEFTGAKDRIDDLISSKPQPNVSDHQWERSVACTRSGWMSPIEIDERTDRLGADVCEGDSPRRGSDKGFLPISLRAYLELVDWTGREVVAGKRGAVPKHLKPILERLGLQPKSWCTLIVNFGSLFRRAVGRLPSMDAETSRRGQLWMHGAGALG
jgi:REP element-mobilizing transposase RayT